jgi:hypothetical protein
LAWSFAAGKQGNERRTPMEARLFHARFPEEKRLHGIALAAAR